MIIGGSRYCGKTTELIKAAHENNLYIVCANKERARHVANLSRKMGLSIPYPIAAEEFPLKGTQIKEVIVDDIEDVLFSLIRKPISMASSSLELKTLGKAEKPPIGIMPKSIWIAKRIQEINEAINRYVDAGSTVPAAWTEELNILLKVYAETRKGA